MSTFTLVTGANGFVGRELCESLAASGRIVRRAVRDQTEESGSSVQIGEVGPDTDWTSALENCSEVIHLAARVHVMRDTAVDPATAFRQVNTLGTLQLAKQAAESGVRRFIFLSSIKVNGESGVFSDNDLPQPQDPYAVSKFEAEQALIAVSKETGMEAVVIRPPLVYGPGVRANFLRLFRAVDKKLFLPLGLVNNQRSLIFLGNLVDAVKCCLDHPNAAGNTYLVSDGDALSTSELIRKIALSLNRSPRLIPVPPALVRLSARLVGKKNEVDRLFGTLVVNSTGICEDLGWRAPFTISQGLSKTAQWYCEQELK